jgi:hypothetical protein
MTEYRIEYNEKLKLYRIMGRPEMGYSKWTQIDAPYKWFITAQIRKEILENQEEIADKRRKANNPENWKPV